MFLKLTEKVSRKPLLVNVNKIVNIAECTEGGTKIKYSAASGSTNQICLAYDVVAESFDSICAHLGATFAVSEVMTFEQR